MKGQFRPEARAGWLQTAAIHREMAEKLSSELDRVQFQLRRAELFAEICSHPPTQSTVLFPQRIISRQALFSSAADLGYRYVAWNDDLFTVNGDNLGSLKDFDL